MSQALGKTSLFIVCRVRVVLRIYIDDLTRASAKNVLQSRGSVHYAFAGERKATRVSHTTSRLQKTRDSCRFEW